MLTTVSFAFRIALALAKRPQLIPTAFRQAAALAPQRWWATGSHLPLPPADYMAFRSATLSGNVDEPPTVHDAIVYLEWCRSMRSLPERA